MLMWTQEVIVSDPECQIIVGTVDVVEPICMAVRGFISTVQSFNHLFEWTMFCRNSIVVGKSNDLSDGKSEIFAEFLCEFHSGKGISTVSVSNKFKVFRKLFEILEGHTHSKDAGPDTTVIRYLIAKDRAGSSIHDQPDIGFDTTDLDVGFISSEDLILFVGVLIHERLNADGCSLTVVGDLLVGDADVIQVF